MMFRTTVWHDDLAYDGPPLVITPSRDGSAQVYIPGSLIAFELDVTVLHELVKALSEHLTEHLEHSRNAEEQESSNNES